MAERPEPDLDQVRDAMRAHDERAENEPPERGDEPEEPAERDAEPAEPADEPPD
jgi:hypothetical protein